MAAGHVDSFILSGDPTFQGRVGTALFAACIAIASEGFGVVFHRERATFAVQILTNLSATNPYIGLFANSVSTDANVLSDATQAGTVALTTSNRAAQQALVTDSHIDSAISGQFNAFVREPAN